MARKAPPSRPFETRSLTQPGQNCGVSRVIAEMLARQAVAKLLFDPSSRPDGAGGPGTRSARSTRTGPARAFVPRWIRRDAPNPTDCSRVWLRLVKAQGSALSLSRPLPLVHRRRRETGSGDRGEQEPGRRRPEDIGLPEVGFYSDRWDQKPLRSRWRRGHPRTRRRWHWLRRWSKDHRQHPPSLYYLRRPSG